LLDISYLWNREKGNFKLNPSDGMLFSFAAGPGLDFEIKNGINIEFLLQYLDLKNVTNPDTYDVKSIIPSIGIQRFF